MLSCHAIDTYNMLCLCCFCTMLLFGVCLRYVWKYWKRCIFKACVQHFRKCKLSEQNNLAIHKRITESLCIILYIISDSELNQGCPESQQNWKNFPLGFPICELTEKSLLSQTKAKPWPKPYKREVRGGWWMERGSGNRSEPMRLADLWVDRYPPYRRKNC